MTLSTSQPLPMSGLEASLAVAGLGLAIPGLIDLCLKYGETLITKVDLYRNANSILSEKYLRFSDHWIKIRTELKFVLSLSTQLPEEILSHFLRLLEQLLGKLEAAIRVLDGLFAKEGWTRKVKFAFGGASDVKNAIEELDEWQGCFSNYLLLLTLVGDPAIDVQLNRQRVDGSQSLERIQRIRSAINTPLSKKLLLSPDDRPEYTQRTIITDSGHEIWMTSRYIIEYKTYTLPSNSPEALQSQHLQNVRADICNLTQVLSASDPLTMNILQSHGFFHNPSKQRFELFYNLPSNQACPRTLRNILLSPENKLGAFHPINHRFRLASQLAQAVLYMHSAKLVHKNIRPETILLTEPSAADKRSRYPHAIGSPFLVGFTKVREIQAESERRGDSDWEKNIYRHPQRQGLHPEQKYSLLHDVYSLGVCLLEICLWMPFIIRDAGRREWRANTDAVSLLEKEMDPNTGKRKIKSPQEIQATFVRKAQQTIPRIMGERFSKIVVSCLTCLEGGLGDMQELMDENGVVVGVAYIERVLQMFDEISI